MSLFPNAKQVLSRFSRVVIVGGLVLTLAACGDGGSSNRPIVKTDNGSIMGVFRNGVDEYRGIRYGQAARWEKAMPQPAWNGVIDAADFGPACAQEARFKLTEESLSEDCLFLNVTTPANASAGSGLPVLVWMPGGAFVGGGGQLYRLDKLAREGKIIVVSVNYRLGVFGFMAHPAIADDSNGNLGLEDQRLALQWVKKNIARFGGDPNNVTLAGESAGGGSACMHLLSGEKTAGLFDKALVQSASCLFPLPTLASALHPADGDQNAAWYKLTKQAGCASDPVGSASELDCLKRKVGADEVKKLLAYQGTIAGEAVMGFSPSIASGTVPLPDYSSASIAKYFNRVPILFGGTQNELRLYVAYWNLFPPKLPVQNISQEDLNNHWLAAFYPDANADIRKKIIKQYFPQMAQGGVTDGGAVGSMVSDFTPRAGINNCGYLYSAAAFAGMTTLYEWEFADPDAPVLGVGIAKGLDPGMALGAVHSSELNYVFPNLSNTAAIDAPDLKPNSQKLADTLVQAWAAFARTGNPSTGAMPNWRPYGRFESGKQVMRFESPERIELYDAYSAHRCSFWSDIYLPKAKANQRVKGIQMVN